MAYRLLSRADLYNFIKNQTNASSLGSDANGFGLSNSSYYLLTREQVSNIHAEVDLDLDNFWYSWYTSDGDTNRIVRYSGTSSTSASATNEIYAVSGVTLSYNTVIKVTVNANVTPSSLLTLTAASGCTLRISQIYVGSTKLARQGTSSTYTFNSPSGSSVTPTSGTVITYYIYSSSTANKIAIASGYVNSVTKIEISSGTEAPTISSSSTLTSYVVSSSTCDALLSQCCYNCTALTSVTLNKVSNIGSYAFYGCTKLSTIYTSIHTSAAANSEPWITSYSNSFTNVKSSGKIYINWTPGNALNASNGYRFDNYTIYKISSTTSTSATYSFLLLSGSSSSSGFAYLQASRSWTVSNSGTLWYPSSTIGY